MAQEAISAENALQAMHYLMALYLRYSLAPYTSFAYTVGDLFRRLNALVDNRVPLPKSDLDVQYQGILAELCLAGVMRFGYI